MRYMILLKYGPEGEAAAMPDEEYMAAMGRFNEELVGAGVLLAGEGLHPTSEGAVVRFSRSGTSVVDGPFAETKELVAGFYLIQVKSKEEAIEWTRRIPMPTPDTEAAIEVRRVFEADDFGEEFTPELREREQRLRDEIARQRGQQPSG
jgi:hypothetical protein